MVLVFLYLPGFPGAVAESIDCKCDPTGLETLCGFKAGFIFEPLTNIPRSARGKEILVDGEVLSAAF